MADTFKFELVSPERLLISEDVAHVVVPGAEGDFGILAGHAPMISTLRAGILKIIADNGEARQIYVRGGFAEAGPENLTVLAQQAIEWAEFNAEAIAHEITNVESELEEAEDHSVVRLSAQQALDQLKVYQADA